MWPEIIKTVATRCQILRPKCTKFDFGWGSAPDPAGGAYSAPPDSLAGFKGLLLRGRGREGGRGGVDPQGFAEMTPLLHVWPKKSEVCFTVSHVGGGLISHPWWGIRRPCNLLQRSVSGVAVWLLVSALTIDSLNTFWGVFLVQCVKLMLGIFEFGFYCLTVFFIAKK